MQISILGKTQQAAEWRGGTLLSVLVVCFTSRTGSQSTRSGTEKFPFSVLEAPLTRGPCYYVIQELAPTFCFNLHPTSRSNIFQQQIHSCLNSQGFFYHCTGNASHYKMHKIYQPHLQGRGRGALRDYTQQTYILTEITANAHSQYFATSSHI